MAEENPSIIIIPVWSYQLLSPPHSLWIVCCVLVVLVQLRCCRAPPSLQSWAPAAHILARDNNQHQLCSTTPQQHHSTMSHNVRYHHNGHSIWRKDKVEYRSIAKLNVKCYSIVSLQPKRPLLPLHNWQGEDHHFPPAGGLHLRVHLPLGLHHLHHPGQGQPGITFFNFGKNFQWPFITLFAGRN